MVISRDVLKEKETLVLDLEKKVDILEQKISKIDDHEKVDDAKATSEDTASKTQSSASDDVKCNLCEFIAKPKTWSRWYVKTIILLHGVRVISTH